jgi:hypothetical protein
MSIEFIEKIHNGVGVQTGGTHNDVSFRLRPVRRVRPAQFFPLHPGECQLLKLQEKKRGTV